MLPQTNPNHFARKKSQQIWGEYMKQWFAPRWILTVNFFFGVLPGILFFVTNVRLSQEETGSLPNVLPDFHRAVSWFGLLFVLVPIFISLFQIFYFHRLISLRMSRTFFIGQLVGLIFYMCSFSKDFLKKFHQFPKKFTFLGWVVILVALVMMLVFLPYLYYFSELKYYIDLTTPTPIQLQKRNLSQQQPLLLNLLKQQ